MMAGNKDGDSAGMRQDTIESFMNSRMVTTSAKGSVADAAKVMVERNVSSVAVTDSNGKIIGILTERDIVKIAAQDNVSLDGITAGSLMSSPLISADKNTTVEAAAQTMIKNKVRHLLIEDADSREIIGIASTTDLARYLRQRLASGGAESTLLEAIYPSEAEGEKLFW